MNDNIYLLNAFEKQIRYCERLMNSDDVLLKDIIKAGNELRTLKKQILERMD